MGRAPSNATMLPGDAPGLAPLFTHALRHEALDKPRKPRSNGGPEGPWWRRPIPRD